MNHIALQSACHPEFTVNLTALVENYRAVQSLSRAETGAVVKADAYGAGIESVVPRLAAAGCESFFVAFASEAVKVREAAPAATIYVMSPFMDLDAEVLLSCAAVPCLYSVEDIRHWLSVSRAKGASARAALHFETGINRLGLPVGSASDLKRAEGEFAGLEPVLIMSHLGCGDEPAAPENQRQLERFQAVRSVFNGVRASLSNSAGVFLGSRFHFDLLRPGVCLFGHDPHYALGKRRVGPVLSLKARLAQVRDLEPGDAVGYGANYICDKPTRAGVVLAGYADGVPRNLSRATGELDGRKAFKFDGISLPILGRVSMDCTVVDLGAVPENLEIRGSMAELYGEQTPVESISDCAGTIPYELFTRVGNRVRRRYL